MALTRRDLLAAPAALGAATCCVVPFVLFFAGISGAWIGNLTAFEPYQPVFVTIALACLVGILVMAQAYVYPFTAMVPDVVQAVPAAN